LQFWLGGEEVRRQVPDPEAMLMPGVRWGHHWVVFTPAYWLSQMWMAGIHEGSQARYAAHGTLDEELVFCILGGFGVTAELAKSAFEACKKANLITDRVVAASSWEETLSHPLPVNGRHIRYRYPRAKAKYLAGAMTYLRESSIEIADGRSLRDCLLKIPGVGPKTAGWVARNYLDTDDVAILDVHIVRAGLLCELFQPTQRVERDYFAMEARFINFCRRLGARPAVLDCLIWDQMRVLGRTAVEALAARSTSSAEKLRSRRQTTDQSR
jgi:thermostable 8-oxoguanine DNA glycosylase